MPNIQSAYKRMRQSTQARSRNRSVKSAIKSLRTRVDGLAKSSEQDQKVAAFRSYCSALDKAAKKGIIKRNAADRLKGRAAKRTALA